MAVDAGPTFKKHSDPNSHFQNTDSIFLNMKFLIRPVKKIYKKLRIRPMKNAVLDIYIPEKEDNDPDPSL